MWSRLRELFKLAGKAALGEGVVGLVVNAYGVIALIEGSKESGWFWLFVGTALVALALFTVAYSALGARDEARRERDAASSAAPSRPQIKAGVISEGKDGGIGTIGSVHGEIHDSSS
jgi:hypothetical protein